MPLVSDPIVHTGSLAAFLPILMGCTEKATTQGTQWERPPVLYSHLSHLLYSTDHILPPFISATAASVLREAIY